MWNSPSRNERTKSNLLQHSCGGCGKLSILFPDSCEVGHSNVVGDGFNVEFTFLGVSLVAG